MANRRAGSFAAIATAAVLAAACGGGDGSSAGVQPLPAGAGTYFASDFLGLGGFYRVDEFSGETQPQSTDADNLPEGTRSCPVLAALDTRSDGLVLAVARRSAHLYEADPRNGLCRAETALPETMAAIAVRPDGRIVAVSATNMLHELDVQARPLAARALVCSGVGPCPVRGIDFAPDGTLHAIVAGGGWSRIDPSTGQLTLIRASVGLSDDFDIDAQGMVRALAGDELRFFDLQGRPAGRAVNVFGGTAFATGVVSR